VSETVLRKHLGGGALGTHILLRAWPADVHEAGRARVGGSHQVAMPRRIVDISMHRETDVVSDPRGYGPKIEYVTQVTPD